MMGQWTGRDTRRLREALRLTVRDFADDLGVSPRTISKWEAFGAARTPRPELQAALDTLLARMTNEQRARFEQSRVAAFSSDQGFRSDSRLVVGHSSGLPNMSVGQLRHVSEMIDQAQGIGEAELAAHFARELHDCQTQDGALGSARALPTALSLIAAIEVTARRLRAPVRLHLLTLAARSAEFVGWLYRDAGALDQAIYWYDRATEWAQEAHNPAMEGYVLLRKSQMAYDVKDAVRVLTLAEAAEHGPYQLPLRVQAEVYQQQALGLSMLGSPVDDVERHLETARIRLSRAVPDDEASQLLGANFTTNTLLLRSAVCYSEIRQTTRATDLFAQVLSTGVLSRRDAGFFTARRAAALALGGEPDEAADLALTSFDVATNVGSQRTMRVLIEVLDLLKTWADRPAVCTLREAISA